MHMFFHTVHSMRFRVCFDRLPIKIGINFIELRSNPAVQIRCDESMFHEVKRYETQINCPKISHLAYFSNCQIVHFF
jgi:hypothetical protein